MVSSINCISSPPSSMFAAVSGSGDGQAAMIGSDYGLLMAYLCIAIGCSFACSIAEAVLLSITPSYIAQRREENTKSALRIVALKENIDRPLAAILSLNTIAHTVGAAGVGAQAARIFGDRYVGVISGILTLLILVLSEIIPKTFGAMHWRRLAGPVAVFVRWLIGLMLPLVWLSELLTKWLSGGQTQRLVTRSEFAAMAEMGSREGLLKQRESRILRNLLRFESIKVEDIMTPSTVVISLDENERVINVINRVRTFPVSRIPIYRDRRDAVSGFVLKSDLLAATPEEQARKKVSDFGREIIVVHEDDSIAIVFDQLLDSRAHIALVVDTYGGTEGILTLEDVVETLLGLEIVDEHDQEANMQELARNRWQQRLQKQGIVLRSTTTTVSGGRAKVDLESDGRARVADGS